MVTTSATVTEVGCSTSAEELHDGTTGRGVAVANASGQTLYVLCGEGTPASDNFTVTLADGAYWETPYGYKGKVSGVLGASTGNVYVTVFE